MSNPNPLEPLTGEEVQELQRVASRAVEDADVLLDMDDDPLTVAECGAVDSAESALRALPRLISEREELLKDKERLEDAVRQIGPVTLAENENGFVCTVRGRAMPDEGGTADGEGGTVIEAIDRALANPHGGCSCWRVTERIGSRDYEWVTPDPDCAFCFPESSSTTGGANGR